MIEYEMNDQTTYGTLLTHFIRAGEASETPVKLNKEFKQVEKSMKNASKDYEIMMKIHHELKENFQKFVQNKT